MALACALRTISPSAGKISPGIMSGPDQRQPTDNGESAHSLHGKLAYGIFGGESKSDAGGVKSGRRERKSCSIGDEVCRDRLGAVCVAMKESEQTDKGCTEPHWGPYRQRHHESEHDDRGGDRSGNPWHLQSQGGGGETDQHR